jgi:hypothetical protein
VYAPEVDNLPSFVPSVEGPNKGQRAIGCEMERGRCRLCSLRTVLAGEQAPGASQGCLYCITSKKSSGQQKHNVQ